MAGSTDLGDLAHLMPVIQPSMNGSSGTFHGNDYALVDREVSYLWNGDLMAETALDLLWGDAARGRALKAQHTPLMTKDEYLRFMHDLSRTETYGEVEVL